MGGKADGRRGQWEQSERDPAALQEQVERERAEQRARQQAARERREREEAEHRERKLAQRREHERTEQERRQGRERERVEETERHRELARRERAKRAARKRATLRGQGAEAPAGAAPSRRRRAAAAAAAAAGPAPPGGQPPRAAHGSAAAGHSHHRHHVSLKRPTAKAVAGLVAVVAIAAGAGAALGLPLPLIGGSDDPVQASTGEADLLAGLSPGTPTGLTKGPYHPVVTDHPGYGEGPAKFGADRGGRKHEGQDIFARPGTPLVAVRDGIVVDGGGGRSFYSSGGGNTLVIYSPIDDRSYVYLHMLKPALVEKGDRVKAGELVGQLGCTGSCDGPHLHFEVRLGRAIFGPQKKAIDPLPLLRQWPVRPVEGK